MIFSTALLTILVMIPTYALTSSNEKSVKVLAAMFGASLPLWLLCKISPTIRYYVKSTLYLSGMGLTSVWGVFISAVMALIGKRENANFVVARSFYRFVGPLVGVTVRVEGTEHLPKKGQSSVIIGNHQSMLDILYLGAFFPKACSIMAKKELQWSPFLGQFMWLSNAVFVDRADRKSALVQFQKVGDTMKKMGISLFVFPEGTRTSYEQPSLLDFKKGAFHLAVQGQIPIVPVVCENYHNVYSSKRKWFDRGEIVVRVLPPISSKGYTSSSEDIARFSSLARDAMLDCLGELASRPGTVSGSTVVERDGAVVREKTKGKGKSS